MVNKTAVLAFSGGLDTSFCLIHLIEKGYDVVTVTADLGGFTHDEIKAIEKRSKELGAKKHYTVPSAEKLFDRIVTKAIKFNALYEGSYPLCASMNRYIICEALVDVAKKEKATTLVHGSTGAGNDQIRFDVSLMSLAPEIEILAPIRDSKATREYETEYLQGKGIDVPKIHSIYSVDESLWGRTMSGGDIDDPEKPVPEEVYKWTVPIDKAQDTPEIITITFENGIPVRLNGEKFEHMLSVQKLNEICGSHGIGRNLYIGNCTVGIKGRLAFEIPAATILLNAHKALEQLVLTRNQIIAKTLISDFWTSMVFHSQYYDPAVKDIEALIDSSQERVSGDVELKLFKGNIIVLSTKSKYSMIKPDVALYGQSYSFDPDDIHGFIKLWGLQSKLSKGLKN